MIESGHPDKCRRIVFRQEEDTSFKIGQDWTALVVEVIEVHHHEESIGNESYELINVDMEGEFEHRCGPPFRKTSEK